jgi:hypothetical protein
LEDDEELGKFPPWVNRDSFYRDLALVVAKYELTLGQFYDGLGVDVYSYDRPVTGDTMTGPINRIADLARTIRKGK